MVAALLTAVVLAGCGAAVIHEPPPGKIVHVTVDSAVDPNDREAVAGWADAIFVGTVQKYLSTEAPESRTPETQYQVSVVDELKGDLPATVVVNQLGGTARNGDIVVVDNVPPLDREKTYLFTTRYYAEKKWLTMAFARELAGPEAEAAQRAGKNPADRAAEPEAVKRMRDAITHEKPFGDEVTRPKLPDPASLPSNVTGIPTPTKTPSTTPKPTGSTNPPSPTR
ncbi:hypothetical protein ACQPW1_01800 [Nocardia sp. CA-128927]|uniref:hypothetical protein n=1 Tax=Nocardia sp. CA-128927 TaxID=3239975 RepID=UPI003D9600B8